MITLRCMADAVLRNGNDFLLMKRNPDRSLAPGLWSSVGGHMEPEEMGRPEKTCLREVYEETGITAEQIRDLRLRYIISRLCGEEIRVHYLFFGYTDIRRKTDCGEGSLSWVPREALLDREMSFTVRSALTHYLSNENAEEILTGTVSAPGGRPVMHWNTLQGWDGMG